MKKRVCIVCSSKLPQPPVLGGAVSQLIQLWIDENEKQCRFDFTCVSVFNEEAVEKSEKFKETKFLFIKIHKFRNVLDSMVTLFFFFF